MAFPVRSLAVALAAVTLIRLAVAATVPLAPDETYYWVWSHALAGGYLDHPPMVALWIKAGTSVFGQTALGVRLLGPLAAAIASWMLFDAGRALFPGTKAGVVAAVLINASLLLGVGSVIMTPDSPLLFFWTATLWAMARVAAAKGRNEGGWWWLTAGIAAGLALDSKYTALFLWIGIGLWNVLIPSSRLWLRRWQPWAAAAAGFALFVPVVLWNAAHDWAGFVKQGGRVQDWQPSRAIGFLAELAGSQIGLATPLVWLLCMAGLVAAVRRWRDPRWALLAALSLPPVLVFVQHAFGDRVQGNWPAIIYPALVLAAGGLAIQDRWWKGAALLGFGITALVYAQATTGLLPLPPRFDPVAMRLKGWDSLARQVETVRRTVGASFVAADGYAVASELAWWLPDDRIVGVDARWRLFALPQIPLGGEVGLLVVDSRRTDAPDPAEWSGVEQVGGAERPGSGMAGFTIYRVTGRRGGSDKSILTQ
ncbi:MAG TPA: UDP-phosphomannose--protein mannosyltransferase [Acetobacteraceae bacterium]|nr:UDP-phosphomannose--protein mannosyltransferase [Acetobacteraceae bacterium]